VKTRVATVPSASHENGYLSIEATMDAVVPLGELTASRILREDGGTLPARLVQQEERACV